MRGAIISQEGNLVGRITTEGNLVATIKTEGTLTGVIYSEGVLVGYISKYAGPIISVSEDMLSIS